jgi:hypothetical protein
MFAGRHAVSCEIIISELQFQQYAALTNKSRAQGWPDTLVDVGIVRAQG